MLRPNRDAALESNDTSGSIGPWFSYNKKTKKIERTVMQKIDLEAHAIEGLSWKEVTKQAPRVPRGWYELMGFPKQDRLQFFLEFWLTTLECESTIIRRFFDILDSIDVYIYRIGKKPYEVCMLYSSKDGLHEFHGAPPLASCFYNPPILGDSVYQSFFRIHNGFGKYDDLGILPYRSLGKAQHELSKQLRHHGVLSREESCLSCGFFPFYGYPEATSYQCFLCDPEVRQGRPSPNICVNTNFLENLEPDFSHYSQFKTSFLEWLEDYLLKSVN